MIEDQILSMMYQSESETWTCSVCAKDSVNKNDIRRHIESAHIQNHPGYDCSYCGKNVKTRDALRKHISCHHRL